MDLLHLSWSTSILTQSLMLHSDVAAIEIAQDADRRRPCHVLVTFCFSEVCNLLLFHASLAHSPLQIAQSILKAAKIICIGGFQFHTSPSSVPAKPASRNQVCSLALFMLPNLVHSHRPLDFGAPSAASSSFFSTWTCPQFRCAKSSAAARHRHRWIQSPILCLA